MRLKGRYIDDRKFFNIPGNGITEIDRGNGIVELKRDIDAITMMPMRKRVRKVKNRNRDILVIASVIVSAFCAGCTFVGMLLIPKICAPIFVGSIAWLTFILWVNE